MTRTIKDISAGKDIKGEIRLVIWEVYDVPIQDINTSDLFIKVILNLTNE